MFKDTLIIHGYRVFKSPIIPEKVQALRMRPCGCSQKALDDMNEYLLKMFGMKREFMVIDGDTVVAHPNNIDWLVEELRPKPAKKGY